MFLGAAELKRMTGTRDKKKQREWLDHNRIPYTVSLKDETNVTVQAVERKHGGVEMYTPLSQWEPNRNVFKADPQVKIS